MAVNFAKWPELRRRLEPARLIWKLKIPLMGKLPLWSEISVQIKLLRLCD